MVSKKTLAVAGVGTALIGVGALLYFWKPEMGETPYQLEIRANSGGTTSPKPGTYRYTQSTSVTVIATPFAGYVFEGWRLNGVLVSTNPSYTVIVDQRELLIASFLLEGQPILTPAYIQPTQNGVAEDWWDCCVEQYFNGDYLRVFRTNPITGHINFKIADNNGNGVPQQQIGLYTNTMPDLTDYGVLYLNDVLHATFATALILTSDSAGIVSPQVKYNFECDPTSTEFETSVGIGGLAHYDCGWGFYGDRYLRDTAFVGTPCGWTDYKRIKHPVIYIRNLVYAYWIDNPNLPVYGPCYVDCSVKLAASHQLLQCPW